jgi:hypothetical protein
MDFYEQLRAICQRKQLEIAKNVAKNEILSEVSRLTSNRGAAFWQRMLNSAAVLCLSPNVTTMQRSTWRRSCSYGEWWYQAQARWSHWSKVVYPGYTFPGPGPEHEGSWPNRCHCNYEVTDVRGTRRHHGQVGEWRSRVVGRWRDLEDLEYHCFGLAIACARMRLARRKWAMETPDKSHDTIFMARRSIDI